MSYHLERRRDELEGLAACVLRVTKNKTRDFTRPIRYGLSDAAGAVFGICDDDLVQLVSGFGRHAQTRHVVWPLVIFCSDADGKEIKLTIRSEKPDSRLTDAPAARHGA